MSLESKVWFWFVEVIDSIAQWTKALPVFPEICNSWHLQGATIPIGANVRVGLVIPPSVFKALFAFHVQVSHQFRSVAFRQACHNSDGIVCVTHSPHAWHCWFRSIHKASKVIYNHVLNFQVLGLGLSQFCFEKSQKTSRPEGCL